MSDSENLVPGIYEQVLSKKLKSHVDKLLSINDKKAFLNKLLKFCISIFANKWLSDAVQHRICCLKINFFTEFLNGIKLG